jgi:Undecaprenyl-phosphate glucose phosphotransferase
MDGRSLEYAIEGNTAGSGRLVLASSPRARQQRALSQPIIAGVVRLLDGVLLLAANVLVPLFLLPGVADALSGNRRQYAVAAIVAAAAALLVLGRSGAHRIGALQCARAALMKAALAVAAGTTILLAVLLALEVASDSAVACAGAWGAAAFLCLAGARTATVQTLASWSRTGRLTKRVALIGATTVSERLIRDMRDGRAAAGRAEIIGVFDDRLSRVPPVHAGVPVVGNVDDLLARSRREVVDSVIIALPVTAKERIGQILAQLESSVADIHVAVDLCGLRKGECADGPLADDVLVGLTRRPLKDWDAFAKRAFDLVVGGALLLVTAPVMLAIALLIKLDSPGPVFFRQKRYGFNNRTIDVLKFRTMFHHERDPFGDRLTQRGDARITAVGGLLRRTSLDELPQLLNVMRGAMSLVGPRPHALHAKAADRLYGDVVGGYARRHRVKPGITGWAQVNGWRGETRTESQIENRVAHDFHYIENWSIWLDLKILALTVRREIWSQHAF